MLQHIITISITFLLLSTVYTGISQAAIKEIDVNQSSNNTPASVNNTTPPVQETTEGTEASADEKIKIADENNPEELTEAVLHKQLERGKFAVLIFKFKNLTGSKENDELVDMTSTVLTRGLAQNKKYLVIEAGIYLDALKSEQFKTYLKVFKKNLDSNVVDYMVGGQVRHTEKNDIIECFIYVTRLNTIKKIVVQSKALQPFAKKMMMELINDSTEEIDNQISKERWQIRRQLDIIPKAPFFTLAGYYGFWFVPNPRQNGFPHTFSGMFTLFLSWELAQALSIRTVKGARDLALFLTIDFGGGPTIRNILDKGSSVDGVKYHFGIWGGVAGLMYKFRVVNRFSIDIGAGYGAVYTQSALWSDYNGAVNDFVPTKHIDERWDHYLNAVIVFNAIIYTNCIITTAYSYKLVFYPSSYLHILVAHIGLGVKF